MLSIPPQSKAGRGLPYSAIVTPQGAKNKCANLRWSTWSVCYVCILCHNAKPSMMLFPGVVGIQATERMLASLQAILVVLLQATFESLKLADLYIATRL